MLVNVKYELHGRLSVLDFLSLEFNFFFLIKGIKWNIWRTRPITRKLTSIFVNSQFFEASWHRIRFNRGR